MPSAIPSITAKADFARFRQARSKSGEFFSVKFLPSGDNLRYGLVVSKKVGNAVVRNFIKRRFRALINNLRDIMLPGDYLFIAFPSAKESSTLNFSREFLRIINSLELK